MAELQRTAPVSRNSRHRRKSRGKKKVIILSILFIILGAVFIYAAIIADKYNNLMDQISAQDPEDGVTDAVYGDNSSVKLPKADSDVTTILLLGTDNRPRLGSLNTDVIMLVSLRPDPRSAVIVSMPRDTYMDPTGWKAGKANGFYAKARSVNKDKAYTYVREIFGEFFDVPIDYVVEIDFKAFEDIIDAFGGITVDVDMDMRYVDPTDGTNINLKKGRQLLDGKQALDFVRYRKSNDGTAESSDFERNMRQQQVISALVAKIKSIETVFRIGEVLDAAGANIKTSIPRKEIESLIRTYAGIKNEDIEFLRLEGTWRSPYVWPNQDSLNEIKQKLKDHRAPLQ